jgi:hypothetical protein
MRERVKELVDQVLCSLHTSNQHVD